MYTLFYLHILYIMSNKYHLEDSDDESDIKIVSTSNDDAWQEDEETKEITENKELGEISVKYKLYQFTSPNQVANSCEDIVYKRTIRFSDHPYGYKLKACILHIPKKQTIKFFWTNCGPMMGIGITKNQFKQGRAKDGSFKYILAQGKNAISIPIKRFHAHTDIGYTFNIMFANKVPAEIMQNIRIEMVYN